MTNTQNHGFEPRDRPFLLNYEGRGSGGQVQVQV